MSDSTKINKPSRLDMSKIYYVKKSLGQPKWLGRLISLEIGGESRNTAVKLGLFALFMPLLVCCQSKDKEVSISFKKTTLLESYISEGVTISDVNADGDKDIVCGAVWWQGPLFKEKHLLYPFKSFPIEGPGLEGYSTNFFNFTDTITPDNHADVLQIGLPGQDSYWYANPGKHKDSLVRNIAQEKVGHESPVFTDIIGNKQKELVSFSNGSISIGIPNVNTAWESLPITPVDSNRFPVFYHGLGVADINGDGLKDVLEKRGWWQQPKNWDKKTVWEFYAYSFSSEKGGAQMYGYDVDGDNDTDVVTSINAHGYGFSWFEQYLEKGVITFREHKIMPAEADTTGVSFSQLHAMEVADIDQDGVLDVVTGKCFYAHNGRDPGGHDPAVLYWFKTTRGTDGTTTFTPHLIDDNSGVGRQLAVGDLNKDDKIDIVTANKKGVFVFVQE